MQYTALFIRDKDAGGYTVRVPALAGCITEGDTLLEAVENTKEAILAYLESLARDNLAAPEDKVIVELYEDAGTHCEYVFSVELADGDSGWKLRTEDARHPQFSPELGNSTKLRPSHASEISWLNTLNRYTPKVWVTPRPLDGLALRTIISVEATS